MWIENLYATGVAVGAPGDLKEVSVMVRFKKLFEAGRIGSVETKNRLVMAPMGTHSCDVRRVS